MTYCVSNMMLNILQKFAVTDLNESWCGQYLELVTDLIQWNRICFMIRPSLGLYTQ